MNWIIENKDWIFDGLGVVALGGMLSLLKYWADNKKTLKVLIHRAYFDDMNEPSIFLKIVNLSKSDIEVTHVWLDTIPKIHFLNNKRPLPVRIQPNQTWETWINESVMKNYKINQIVKLGRVLDSSGNIFKSKENTTVPEEGYVAGE